MPKYLVKWNVGYGDSTDVIEFDSEAEAEAYAYESWREEAESNATYSAEILTKENAEDYGHEDEL